MTDPALASRPRLRATARIRARHDPCALCGQPIDYTLPDPHTLTRMVRDGRITPQQRTAILRLTFTVDEIVPRSLGGSASDMRNLRPAHFGCNSSRGNGTRRRRPWRQPLAPQPVQSRAW